MKDQFRCSGNHLGRRSDSGRAVDYETVGIY